MKHLLFSLLSFYTVAENRRERKKALKFLEKIAKSYQAYTEYGENPEPWLLISYAKKPWQPKVGVLCHMDVVPGEIKPREINGKIYARGSYDMKGPLVASFFALVEEKRDVSLLITSDEEVGGKTAENLAKKFKPKKVLLVPDSDAFKIIIKEKGVVHFSVTTEGKTAHGSTPWKGENAIDKMIKIYFRLKKALKPKNEKEGFHNTLNFGMIRAGERPNVIPSHCEAKFDFRFSSGNVAKWERKIEKAVGKLGKVKFLASGEVLITKRNAQEVKLFQEILSKTFNEKVEISYEHGATDARHFAKHGIPIILVNAKGGNAHAKDEFVEYESLEKFKEALKIFFTLV